VWQAEGIEQNTHSFVAIGRGSAIIRVLVNGFLSHHIHPHAEVYYEALLNEWDRDNASSRSPKQGKKLGVPMSTAPKFTETTVGPIHHYPITIDVNGVAVALQAPVKLVISNVDAPVHPPKVEGDFIAFALPGGGTKMVPSWF
jgi:hypothetical protein